MADCIRKERCGHYPEQCGMCGAMSDIYTHYPLFKDKDLVEVVRCKDCKHSYFVKSCSKYECRKGCGTLKYSTDFCSYGERSNENAE